MQNVNGNGGCNERKQDSDSKERMTNRRIAGMTKGETCMLVGREIARKKDRESDIMSIRGKEREG